MLNPKTDKHTPIGTHTCMWVFGLNYWRLNSAQYGISHPLIIFACLIATGQSPVRTPLVKWLTRVSFRSLAW